MSFSQYIPILIQIAVATLIAAGILVASHLFGQRSTRTTIKDAPYECGMLMEGKAHPRFSVKFYVTAMLFIIFDIEIVFLVPWTLIHREFTWMHIPILGPIACFLGLLIIGLWYEIKKGALDWDTGRTQE